MENLLSNPYFVKGLHSLALTVVTAFLCWIALSVASKRGKRSSEASYAIKYTALFFYGASLLFIWLEGIGPVLTALTIVAAALTIVSKELLLNFIGSFVIFWRELFTIGDRVRVGDNTGDVVDKGVLYFTLLEVGGPGSTGHSTGKLIKVPNAQVLTLPVVNESRGAGFIWNEVKFTFSRQSDWRKGREILRDTAEAYIQDQGINVETVRRNFENSKVFFRQMKPIVYVTAVNSGICLTLRYICKVRTVRESENFITTRLLDALEPGVLELADVLF